MSTTRTCRFQSCPSTSFTHCLHVRQQPCNPKTPLEIALGPVRRQPSSPETLLCSQMSIVGATSHTRHLHTHQRTLQGSSHPGRLLRRLAGACNPLT
ncbi:hypothetical protein IG631_13582 [Alternaria alternata]|nr:hypothetical protein IG631_13582 [Alternaria alternata]